MFTNVIIVNHDSPKHKLPKHAAKTGYISICIYVFTYIFIDINIYMYGVYVYHVYIYMYMKYYRVGINDKTCE